jgi:hypothetical protein
MGYVVGTKLLVEMVYMTYTTVALLALTIGRQLEVNEGDVTPPLSSADVAVEQSALE